MHQDSALLPSPRRIARDMAIAGCLGIFLGVIGPFGSYLGGPMELRIPYWMANLWIGLLLLQIAARLSIRAAEWLDAPIWFAVAVGVALADAPLAEILARFSHWFWPADNGSSRSFATWYGQVVVLSEPLSFAYLFILPRFQGVPQVPTGTAATLTALPVAADAAIGPSVTESSFLDRLPGRLGRELLCLQMEDHYVRAHTPRGSDLVLISLKEALGDLQHVDGLQVHRSWWVRRSAVQGVTSKGRSVTLRLVNGLEVPVSRSSVAKLRGAGWLSSVDQS